jgi:hypothetical protein
VVPTSPHPPRRNGCSVVEASRETHVVLERVVHVTGGGGAACGAVAGVASAVGLKVVVVFRGRFHSACRQA